MRGVLMKYDERDQALLRRIDREGFPEYVPFRLRSIEGKQISHVENMGKRLLGIRNRKERAWFRSIWLGHGREEAAMAGA